MENYNLFLGAVENWDKWFEEFNSTMDNISIAESNAVFEEIYLFLLEEKFKNNLYAFATEDGDIQFKLDIILAQGEEGHYSKVFYSGIELGFYPRRNFTTPKDIWEVFQEVQKNANFILEGNTKIKL